MSQLIEREPTQTASASSEELGSLLPHQTSYVMGAISTEKKVFTLASAGSAVIGSEYRTPGDSLQELRDSGVTKDQVDLLAVAVVLRRFAEHGLLEPDSVKELFRTGYRRNEIGLIALGASGLILGDAIQHSIPMKFLTGEQSQRKHRHGTTTDAILTRYQIFRHLLTLPPDEFTTGPELARSLESSQGVLTHAARTGLNDLSQIGILEKIRSTLIGKRSVNKFRWSQENFDRLLPVITRYVEVFETVQSLDSAQLAKGIGNYIALSEQLKADGRIPFLIDISHMLTPKHHLYREDIDLNETLRLYTGN